VNATQRDVGIEGSIGPKGEILQPAGTLSYDDAYQAFKEQADALKTGGADVLWIETISDANEAKAACEASLTTGLPVVYTMSIDTNGRTMMGVTPAELINLNSQLSQSVHACGTNCGIGASEVVAAIMNMQRAAKANDTNPVLVAKANCGIPEYLEGKIVYSGTPELMAEYARFVLDAGATIIGGCCGTTPEHIAAMKHALETHTPGETPNIDHLESILGPVTIGSKAQLNGDLTIQGGSLSGEKRTRKSRRTRRD
jgi:5-methyltetrahydrofolate--homocysteine methyltransferase